MNNNQKIRIGVMGSAQGPSMDNQEGIEKSRKVGEYLAENDCILVNGACPGLPNEAAIGAKSKGGTCIGISPAFSFGEHCEIYKSPYESYDFILYTGRGFMERDITNIRASDGIIILGGGVGTLNEFTVAYDAMKIVGVLKGTGGVSDNIPEILKMCNRELNERVIISEDPKDLVKQVLDRINTLEAPYSKDQRVIGKKIVNK